MPGQNNEGNKKLVSSQSDAYLSDLSDEKVLRGASSSSTSSPNPTYYSYSRPLPPIPTPTPTPTSTTSSTSSLFAGSEGKPSMQPSHQSTPMYYPAYPQSWHGQQQQNLVTAAHQLALAYKPSELRNQLNIHDKAIADLTSPPNKVSGAGSWVREAIENNPKSAAAGFGFLGMYAAFNARKIADSGLPGADHGTMIVSALTAVLLITALYLAFGYKKSNTPTNNVGFEQNPKLLHHINQRAAILNAINIKEQGGEIIGPQDTKPVSLSSHS